MALTPLKHQEPAYPGRPATVSPVSWWLRCLLAGTVTVGACVALLLACPTAVRAEGPSLTTTPVVSPRSKGLEEVPCRGEMMAPPANPGSAVPPDAFHALPPCAGEDTMPMAIPEPPPCEGDMAVPPAIPAPPPASGKVTRPQVVPDPPPCDGGIQAPDSPPCKGIVPAPKLPQTPPACPGSPLPVPPPVRSLPLEPGGLLDGAKSYINQAVTVIGLLGGKPESTVFEIYRDRWQKGKKERKAVLLRLGTSPLDNPALRLGGPIQVQGIFREGTDGVYLEVKNIGGVQ